MRSDKYKLRVKAVRELLYGEPQKSICNRYGITRQTLYFWVKKYRKNPSQPQLLLNDHYIRGRKHPKTIPFTLERAVLDLVVSQPLLNHREIAFRLNEANKKISDSGVYSILVRHNLHVPELRQEFSREHPANTVITAKLAPAYRAKAVAEHLDEGKPVSHICKKWLVSRPTFYKWLNRYQEALKEAVGKPYEPKVIEALVKRYRRGHEHQNSIGSEVREVILNIVKSSPSLSVHRIYAQVPRVANKPIASHAAIQNLLTREGLNRVSARLEFANAHAGTGAAEVKTASLYTPDIPLYKLRHLIAHFATVPKLAVTKPKVGIPVVLITYAPIVVFILWSVAIISSPRSLGLIFASISLFFGLFFFLYSLKYYISALIVLRLAHLGAIDKDFLEKENEKGGRIRLNKWLSKVLSLTGFAGVHQLGKSHLRINLDKTELLGRRPFVSVHIALYNEYKVVERLIRACEAQEWGEDAGPVSRFPPVSAPQPFSSKIDDPNLGTKSQKGGVRADGSPSSAATRRGMANYEVVIADDSTDETTEIAKQLLSSEGRILDRILFNEEMEIYVSSPPVGSSLPVIKLIHRFSRFGFKGGALQKALENTNPKAQYVTVFDADFVPYPDTLTQFVKTFQVLGRSTKSTTSITSTTSNEKTFDTSDTFGTSDTSNIAAVQGYQWHVLNKSQNWVTRGVRTEYAGSYVIERAGEEIYGGLKQIAGSVYMIRADILRQFGWGKSITEDFELTLRLYERGYKVAFTPYIQAPAEAVSTLKRLIRQRMRWAEGASFNIKVMLARMLWGRWESQNNVILGSEATPESIKADSGQARMTSEGKVWVKSRLTRAEKLEFAYLAPYYLQAAFFVIGTFSWFISETIIGTRLPFWTAALGWSLVFTNLLALPLMNIVGMFLEESDERDYIGILSFIALSYIVVPFQAYAAIKGFLEREEGPWFRTPKTGLITDKFGRAGFSKFFGNILGREAGVPNANLQMSSSSNRGSDSHFLASLRGRSGRENDMQGGNDNGGRRLALASAYNPFISQLVKMSAETGLPPASVKRRLSWAARGALVFLLIVTITLFYYSHGIPVAEATNMEGPLKLDIGAGDQSFPSWGNQLDNSQSYASSSSLWPVGNAFANISSNNIFWLTNLLPTGGPDAVIPGGNYYVQFAKQGNGTVGGTSEMNVYIQLYLTSQDGTGRTILQSNTFEMRQNNADNVLMQFSIGNLVGNNITSSAKNRLGYWMMYINSTAGNPNCRTNANCYWNMAINNTNLPARLIIPSAGITVPEIPKPLVMAILLVIMPVMPAVVSGRYRKKGRSVFEEFGMAWKDLIKKLLGSDMALDELPV